MMGNVLFLFQINLFSGDLLWYGHCLASLIILLKKGGSNSRKHCTDGASVQLTFSEAPGFTVISKSRLANSYITVDVQLVKNRKKAHL